MFSVPDARRKLQVSNGYDLAFEQLAQILNALRGRPDLKRVPRAFLVEQTGLAERQIGSLVSIGCAIGVLRPTTGVLTGFGRLVAEHDIFFEMIGTLEFCHYTAASDQRHLVWFDTFNELLRVLPNGGVEEWKGFFRSKYTDEYSKKSMQKHVRVEEGYLIRTIGSIASAPDVALTELVANAWDAGASRVQIQIPDTYDEWISVEDDGCGMSPDQFRLRWMTLGYNRAARQGQNAEFPKERDDWQRRAYGRNGVGRHGMHCFSEQYEVETWRDGVCSHFTVAASSGDEPFELTSEQVSPRQGHGTKIRALVMRHLPNADRIRAVLSARFLHDPRFEVEVIGVSVPLAEHPGVIDEEVLKPTDAITLRVTFIDSTQRARTKQRQGIAFWVGGRLVGEPTWTLGDLLVIDGRTSFAKRYTVVVQSDDLFDDVLPDWSAFLKTARIAQAYEAVAQYVQRVYSQVCADRIGGDEEDCLAGTQAESFVDALKAGIKAKIQAGKRVKIQ